MSPHSDVGAPARFRRIRTLGARALVAGALIAVAAVPAVAGGSTGGSSPGAYKASNAKTLRPGDSGPAVKRLQRRLSVRATGYYGTLTKRAVRRFQRRHDLRATGVANRKTLRKLGLTRKSGSVKLPAELKRIAECESGGNPRAVSPDGRYRGKYQFDQDTWEAWGGTGDPAKASERFQDRVALRLYRARGTAPWPNCA